MKDLFRITPFKVFLALAIAILPFYASVLRSLTFTPSAPEFPVGVEALLYFSSALFFPLSGIKEVLVAFGKALFGVSVYQGGILPTLLIYLPYLLIHLAYSYILSCLVVFLFRKRTKPLNQSPIKAKPQ